MITRANLLIHSLSLRLWITLFFFQVVFSATSQTLNQDSVLAEFNSKSIADQKEMIYTYGGSGAIDSSDSYFLADLMESVEGTEVELLTNRVTASSIRANAMYKLGDKSEAMRLYKVCLFHLDTIFDKITPEYEKFKGLKRMQSAYNLNIGLSYNGVSNSKDALIYLDRALVQAQEIDNLPFIRKILTTKGNLFTRIGDHDSAAEFFHEAMKVEESKETVFKAETNRSLGNIYLTRGQPEVALEYFKEGLAIIKRLSPELDRSVHIVQALSGMHQYYAEVEDYERSDSILQEILKEDPEKENYYQLSYRYFTQALLASQQGSFKKAYAYLGEAEKIIPDDHTETLAAFYLYKAKVLRNDKKYSTALSFANKSLGLGKQVGNKKSISESYKLLSDIENQFGHFRSSRKYLEKHLLVSDSIMNEKIGLNQDILAVKYETEKKEKELLALKTRELESSAKLERKNNFLKGSVGGACLLGLLALSLFRNNKRKKESNLLLQEKNKIIKSKNEQNELLLKEIHHRVKNNLQTISSLLYLQSANIDDADAKDAITVGQQRVDSMALIHKNLYQRDNMSAIEMKEYISKLIANLKAAYIKSDLDIDIELNMKELEMDLDQAIPLGLIINELITNVFKYAFEGKDSGRVVISLQKPSENDFILKVEDNGTGKHGPSTGFGSKLIKLLSKQLEATLTDGNAEGYWCEISKVSMA